MKNYYEILEVHNKASLDTIKKVFKFQIKKYHPDVVEDDKKEYAEKKVQELNEAYEILSDNEKRKAYDEFLEKSANAPSNKEKILQEQVDFLKEKLQEKEQIIEHFLGSLDLSEYENTLNNNNINPTFNNNLNIDYDIDDNQNLNNQSEYFYNENPTTLLEKIQNFFSPYRPYKSIPEKYMHTLLVYIVKICFLIIALLLFFLLVSIFTNTNVFEILFNVFFYNE